jgi:copper chaperone CopZ
MNLARYILPVCMALPCAAQVEKVAIKTTGISCGICAGISEIYFHRLQGVDKVKISLSNEAILLTYKPGAKFDTQAIRRILEPLKVGVVQFQVGVHGLVHETGGKRILVAGQDQFILLDAIDSPDVPVGVPIGIEGILYDRQTPVEIKVLTVQKLH